MARILIADDDVAYLAVFCEGMEAKGHACTGVTSGTQLLDLAGRSTWDIVFLDVLMQGGGAITLIHELDKLDPDLPAVIITGRPELVESPLMQQGLRSARAKMRKTATLDQIDAVVRRHARSPAAGAG
ncbi:response regulator [Mangrovicoccus sp. HB161399]|uniref:response regulator n=1 Tax=Mangrovicoccus sp. HB161399 TaxID=2720392 RepID=UPI0015582D68